MVTTGGVKMGKSLGNSAMLRDLYQAPFGRGEYDPLSLRFTLLQSHYRSTTEFTEDAITASATGYGRLVKSIKEFQRNFPDQPFERRSLTDEETNSATVRSFIEAMDDDFNTPKAIAVLFEATKDIQRSLTGELDETWAEMELESKYQQLSTLAGDVLGILPTHDSTQSTASTTLDHVMKLNINWRKAARDRRDFAMSDTIRKELEEAGIILEDSKEGTTWRMK